MSLGTCDLRLLLYAAIRQSNEDLNALGAAYNEFGYNEHSDSTNGSISIKIIDSDVKRFI